MFMKQNSKNYRSELVKDLEKLIERCNDVLAAKGPISKENRPIVRGWLAEMRESIIKLTLGAEATERDGKRMKIRLGAIPKYSEIAIARDAVHMMMAVRVKLGDTVMNCADDDDDGMPAETAPDASESGSRYPDPPKRISQKQLEEKVTELWRDASFDDDTMDYIAKLGSAARRNHILVIIIVVAAVVVGAAIGGALWYFLSERNKGLDAGDYDAIDAASDYEEPPEMEDAPADVD